MKCETYQDGDKHVLILNDVFIGTMFKDQVLEIIEEEMEG